MSVMLKLAEARLQLENIRSHLSLQAAGFSALPQLDPKVAAGKLAEAVGRVLGDLSEVAAGMTFVASAVQTGTDEIQRQLGVSERPEAVPGVAAIFVGSIFEAPRPQPGANGAARDHATPNPARK